MTNDNQHKTERRIARYDDIIDINFDMVISVDAIHHVEASRKEALFGELKEMLKPEGWIFVSDFIVPKTDALKSAQYELWMDEVVANFERIRSDSKQVGSLPETLPDLAEEYFLTLDLAALTKKFQEGHAKEGDRPSPLSHHIAWLEKAGFNSIEVQYRYSDFVILSAQRGQNPISVSDSETSSIKLSSLWDEVRTFFVNHWVEWEWPVDFAEELEKMATELSTGAIEILRENKSREDIASLQNIPAKIF